MKKQAISQKIIQGNGITYMTADLSLVHLKVLMTIIKELQSYVNRMVNDMAYGRLRPADILPMPQSTAIGNSAYMTRKVTIRIGDIGLGQQNTKYLMSCLEMLREKACVFPSDPAHPAKSEKILVTGLLSHFEYNKTEQTIDVYLHDKVALTLLLVKDGYTKYDYLQAMQFENKYTVRMYWIINSWRGRKGFRIRMDQLRYLMSAEDKYPRNDNFISKVINVAYDELKAKGDIWFEYSRDCRPGHDVFAFKVYQRLDDEKRSKIVEKARKHIGSLLIMEWRIPVQNVNDILSKITADNADAFWEHFRYLTDTVDIKSLNNPALYLEKAINTFLESLSDIDVRGELPDTQS